MNGDRKRTVLIVDDEALAALTESIAVKGFGYDVVLAHSGEEAVELASAGAMVELVLMDIDLGGAIDGPGAARMILGRRDVPIVFMSERPGMPDDDRMLDLPRYGCVAKRPGGERELRYAIEAAFERFDATEGLRRERDELFRRNAELRASEERCRTIAERSIDCVYTMRHDREGAMMMLAGPGCASVSGYSAEEIASRPHSWLAIVAPEDRRSVKDFARRLGTDGGPSQIEHRILKKDGSVGWIKNIPVPRFDSGGDLVSVDGIVVDITERKAVEERTRALLEEKDAILKELRHRVKDSMANFMGILSLQAVTSEEPSVRDALMRARSRMQCIDVLFEKLSLRTPGPMIGAREYFDEVVPDIFEALSSECEISIASEIEDILLPAEYFFPIGVIVNELVANAVEHAFAGRRNGSVAIRFRASSDSECVLSVSDDGIGGAERGVRGTRGGLGTLLVEAMTSQLGGKTQREAGPGTHCTVVFPVENCVRP